MYILQAGTNTWNFETSVHISGSRTTASCSKSFLFIFRTHFSYTACGGLSWLFAHARIPSVWLELISIRVPRSFFASSPPRSRRDVTSSIERLCPEPLYHPESFYSCCDFCSSSFLPILSLPELVFALQLSPLAIKSPVTNCLRVNSERRI